MSDTTFETAIGRITSGGCAIIDLIQTADDFAARGRHDLAQQLYLVWIGLNPDHPQRFAANFNVSGLISASGDLAGARAQLEAALAMKPDFAPALINLGGVLERQGDIDAALECWRTLAAQPVTVSQANVGYHLAALKQLARVLTDEQRCAAAEAVLRQSAEVDPRQRDVIEQLVAMRLSQCVWPAVVTSEGLDRRTLVSSIHPLSMAAYADDPLLQLGSAAGYVDAATADRPVDPAADRRRAPIDLAGRRLRVGYVSSDLRDHAIGYLMAELFELHDRAEVEVFAYYCGIPSISPLTQRIQAAVEHWRDIRDLTDEAAARRIAADQVDILVDVNGHTRDARIGVFARRPAPIQVNWLGFPGTMGSSFHHYLIADPNIVPPQSERFYSERVVRLSCYQPNDRRRAVAEPRPTRAEAGLPDDAVVFCCFNAAHKITPFTFARWMEILKRTPGSVLWLLESSRDTQGHLLAHAAEAGVAPGRLIFAPKQPNAQHLARYALADLFLDTAPYGAHTTASDALWMGAPVLTFWGRSFAARVCGSLVGAAGLPDLVCQSPREFVETAVALGRDPPRLAALRARLEAGRATCDLFNMDRLTADLEALYRGMAKAYQAGDLPRPDLTNLEAYLEVGAGLDLDHREMADVDDYDRLWKTALAQRHLARPLTPDGRVWTAADIAALEGRPAPTAEASAPQARAAGGRR